MGGIINRIKEAIKLHINIPKTLFFNFKVFNFNTAIKFPVFLYGRVDLEGLYRGCVELKNTRIGGVKFGGGWPTQLYGYSNRFKSFLRIKGKLYCGGNVIINQGAVVSINEGANVKIGNNVRISERLTLHSKFGVEIGDNCFVGWNTQILDSDFHYILNDGFVSYRNARVTIKQNVWLANGVTVLKGSCLPAYSIVASQSLVNKDFSDKEEKGLYAGVPARYIKGNVERIQESDAIIDELFHSPFQKIKWDSINKASE